MSNAIIVNNNFVIGLLTHELNCTKEAKVQRQLAYIVTKRTNLLVNERRISL